ncbi:hypothetical protein EVAR_92330_1 [Eumeta japonica]|uniref:Uncharacterized protein n=1 Tax=Eumeta variegata TaxID=151549 RepID=A0A4C1TL48_EUMVA|nr:hypothetical protein EVAR_92330_1 [Eumeta japonica]
MDAVLGTVVYAPGAAGSNGELGFKAAQIPCIIITFSNFTVPAAVSVSRSGKRHRPAITIRNTASRSATTPPPKNKGARRRLNQRDRRQRAQLAAHKPASLRRPSEMTAFNFFNYHRRS